MEHWHIDVATDEDSESAYPSIYQALDALAWELDNLLDFEIQGITALGDSGDFEEAYRSYQRSEKISNVLDNIRNVVKQHDLPVSDRAPFYQTGWGNDDSPDNASMRLLESAKHVAEMVNSDTRLSIWHCQLDDVKVVKTDAEPTEDGVALFTDETGES